MSNMTTKEQADYVRQAQEIIAKWVIGKSVGNEVLNLERLAESIAAALDAAEQKDDLRLAYAEAMLARDVQIESIQSRLAASNERVKELEADRDALSEAYGLLKATYEEHTGATDCLRFRDEAAALQSRVKELEAALANHEYAAADVVDEWVDLCGKNACTRDSFMARVLLAQCIARHSASLQSRLAACEKDYARGIEDAVDACWDAQSHDCLNQDCHSEDRIAIRALSNRGGVADKEEK